MARPVVVIGEGSQAPRVVLPGPAKSSRPAPSPPKRPSQSGTREPASVFGSDLISERSLDEVILAYLAEDSEGEGER